MIDKPLRQLKQINRHLSCATLQCVKIANDYVNGLHAAIPSRAITCSLVSPSAFISVSTALSVETGAPVRRGHVPEPIDATAADIPAIFASIPSAALTQSATACFTPVSRTVLE